MDKNYIEIRKAQDVDFDAIWGIFSNIISSGDSYVYDPNTTKDEARSIWCGEQVQTHVALNDKEIVGTYIIKPNFPGLGSHVANASYMVGSNARGLGIGRLMGEHSIAVAKEAGYLAMQFNIVVSTNHTAIKLWQSLGFKIIGTSPNAFRHKTLGLVDAHIMHLNLV